jgi:hypothetical protein
VLPNWGVQHTAASCWSDTKSTVSPVEVLFVTDDVVNCWVVMFRNSHCPERPSRAGLAINGRLFTKTDLAERWMRSLIDTYCDVMPDEGDLHLPFGTRKDVYELYAK